jgi:hypothetical protein
MHAGLPLRLAALLAAVVAVLALSAVVMAAAKPGDAGPSSNYLGPPVTTPSQERIVRGSNIPRWAQSDAVAPRPRGTNQPTTP